MNAPTPLNTAQWVTFFQNNQINRPVPRWEAPLQVSAEVRPLLEQSLREFQLGDGGGPASLIAWNVASYRDSQPGLGEVIDLWFAEEQEHSRLLGGLLSRFLVEPIPGHWSFSLFCFFRRWLGVKFELQILTLTELSSTAYYWLLLRHCEDAAVRDVCSLILRDEAGHLAFQSDRLSCSGAPWDGWRRVFWKTQFWVSGVIAASVLWLSHGRCLKALGVSTARFYGEATRQFTRFLARLELRARAKVSAPDAALRWGADRARLS